MIAVVQRVLQASVTVEAEGYCAQIRRGLCVLLGVEQGDGDPQADWMAGKIARLRIFPDEQDKMNRSVDDIDGEVLVVSQFTLAADLSRGNRPGFSGAAEPGLARALYGVFCARLAGQGVPVETGEFAAHRAVRLVNDGPVTLWTDSRGRSGGRRGRRGRAPARRRAEGGRRGWATC